jgi:hypothetical protein
MKVLSEKTRYRLDLEGVHTFFSGKGNELGTGFFECKRVL